MEAVAHAFNDTAREITKNSPFELLYGCHSRIPWHLQLMAANRRVDPKQVTTYDQRVANLLKKHENVYKIVQQSLIKAAERMKRAVYGRKTKKFEVGDKFNV